MHINKKQNVDGVDLFPMISFKYKPCKTVMFLGKYSFNPGRKTDIGMIVNAFKYHQDKSKGFLLAKLMAKFVKENLYAFRSIDYIVPVPPSYTKRMFQPVYFLADEISKILKIPYSRNVKKIKETPLMKNINGKSRKEAYLKDAFQIINDRAYNYKKILIVDDILTDGATLLSLANCLIEKGKVNAVYAVIAAKTF